MISVIIPCFNEENTIAHVIYELREKLGKDVHIIVVDNGSTDGTYFVASQCQVDVHKEPKQGKGFAFRRGLLNIRKDSKVIFLVDGDGTYSLSNLPRDVGYILDEGFDMVVGNRTVENDETKPFREGHEIGNRFFSEFSRKMFTVNITDALSGYRVMSRGFATSLTYYAGEFELETELNVHAFHLDISVRNSDVLYKSRPEGSQSKLRTYSDGLKILRRIFSLWFTERPLRAYFSLALPLYLISFVLSLRAIFPFFETGLVPNLPSLVASIGILLLASTLSMAGLVLDRMNVLRRSISRYNFSKSNE
jgi:glycosyltransferase involved in cell wall biosynthesis